MEQVVEGIDPDAARRAFTNLKPLFDTRGIYRRTNTDLDKAAVIAAAIGRVVNEPEVRARFESLPFGEFDMVHIERLESAALATWYAGVARRSAVAGKQKGRLPQDILTAARATKQRMLKVLDYHLGDQQDIAAMLVHIRSCRSHVELAGALISLADLYEKHAEQLAGDNRYYRADERDDARRLALTMHQILGDGREDREAYWSDYQLRAWGFLLATYREVSAAGRWLFRDEQGDERFPSLYTVGRQRRGRRGQEQLESAAVGDDESGEGGESGEAGEGGESGQGSESGQGGAAGTNGTASADGTASVSDASGAASAASMSVAAGASVASGMASAGGASDVSGVIRAASAIDGGLQSRETAIGAKPAAYRHLRRSYANHYGERARRRPGCLIQPRFSQAIRRDRRAARTESLAKSPLRGVYWNVHARHPAQDA